MRFTSLIVELVRARPKLIFWIVVSLQAALWVILPVLLYRSPPGDVATLLAFGREYQVGTDIGPPLAFWLGDLAFRAAGNHMIGVYLLAQVSFVVMMWALFELGAAIVGRQQSVLAVMLTATIIVFSFPGAEFGPAVLARPLWALVLLHSWRVIGQGRGNAWFALSIETGLLLLTYHAALLLLALMVGFTLFTKRGRRSLASIDPWFALVVVVVLVLPYLAWLARASVLQLPPWPALADLKPRALRWGELLASLLLAMAGIAILVVTNARRFARRPDEAPAIFRAPVDPFARSFVLFFAIVPPLAATLLTALFGFDQIAGGAGTVIVMTGLAVIVLGDDLLPLRRQEVLRTVWGALIVAPAAAALAMTFIMPWASTSEIKTSLPAKAMGQFFSDSFERRTGQQLRAVAGDAELAALIGLGAPRRPHVFFDSMPDRTPWLTSAQFATTGGIVVWRAADTAGTPPDDIARHFPGIAPEVPRAFERMVNGRQPLLRIGWAIVRPKTP